MRIHFSKNSLHFWFTPGLKETFVSSCFFKKCPRIIDNSASSINFSPSVSFSSPFHTLSSKEKEEGVNKGSQDYFFQSAAGSFTLSGITGYL